jgi:hypothetical protein
MPSSFPGGLNRGPHTKAITLFTEAFYRQTIKEHLPTPNLNPPPQQRECRSKLGRWGVDVDLAVLADAEHDSVGLPPHDALERAQVPPDLDELTLDQQDVVARGRPETGYAQRSGDAQGKPEARPRRRGDGQSGAEVEERRHAAAVHVPHPVAVLRPDRVPEDDPGVQGVLG